MDSADYIKQLEQRNEELQEMLIMSEADAAAYKCFIPRWREFVSCNGLEFAYECKEIDPRIGNKWVIAEIRQAGCIGMDKPWFARIHFIKDRYMEFFYTPEDAKREVERIYMEFLRSYSAY